MNITTDAASHALELMSESCDVDGAAIQRAYLRGVNQVLAAVAASFGVEWLPITTRDGLIDGIYRVVDRA